MLKRHFRDLPFILFWTTRDAKCNPRKIPSGKCKWATCVWIIESEMVSETVFKFHSASPYHDKFSEIMLYIKCFLLVEKVPSLCFSFITIQARLDWQEFKILKYSFFHSEVCSGFSLKELPWAVKVRHDDHKKRRRTIRELHQQPPNQKKKLNSQVHENKNDLTNSQIKFKAGQLNSP